MSQKFTWGSSSQQQSGRRGLTPISTAFNSSNRSTTSSNSPSRTAFSPLSSNFPSIQAASTRHVASRNSSASSTSSPFSPLSGGSQQQQPNQLLSSARSRTIAPSNNTPLASSAAALPTASQGGGGASSSGGGGATRLARASPSLSQSSAVGSPSTASNNSAPPGQSLAKIVVAQVFLLLSSLKEDKDKDRAKWETQADNIRKLIHSHGMEVFSKYFRRLLQANAAQIFPGSGRTSENPATYPLLVGEMQKIMQDPQQAYKIAESIDTPEGDMFRDFDLSTFMDHFKLDPVAKTALALACKTASKPDLRTKADAILSNNFPRFMDIIGSPQADIQPSFLAAIIDRLVQDPPRNWSEEGIAQLRRLVITRYQSAGVTVPVEVDASLYLFELFGSSNPLLKLVQRAGPRATATLEACKEMLTSAEARDISYQNVASVLLFMVITQGGQAYNASNFIGALREHRAGNRLDWQDVVHSFDRDGLRVSKQHFLSLYDALLPVAKDSENFDIQLLWGGVWAHPWTQLSFVVAFLSCGPDELDASQIPRLRQAFTLDQFNDAMDEVKAFAEEAVRHPLVSLDATTTLFSMIFRDHEHYNQAQLLRIPELVINTHTEIFVVSASATPKPWGGLQDQALRQLFGPFMLKSLSNYNFVLHGVWKQDNQWLATRLMDAYNTNPMALMFILEHAQNHGWLQALIEINSDMSLDLAALANGRGLFDVEPWAQQMFQQMPAVFPRVLANFLANKAQTDLETQREHIPPTTVPLTVKTVHAFLEMLQEHLPDDDLVRLQRTCIGAYPRLINYGEGFDEIIDANGKESNALSEDADKKMQEHYKNMYSGESDVRDIIAALQKYKVSQDPADQDLFACMIHGLFDEYNCFGEYPLEALATTAVLFGGIINYNLLSRVALQAGLAMVLEAVQEYRPEDSMYKFGLQALLHFSNRLQEWPSFCDRLLRVPGLQGTEIWAKAEEIVGRQRLGETNGEAQNGVVMANGGNADDFRSNESTVPHFTCLHVDPPFRPDLFEPPEEEIQDKVLFVLNNVSERNLKDKLQDLQEALEEKHFQWFADYLVEQRAKMQPNFQQLYLDMLELFNDQLLWKEVLRETYVAVIKMLNAEATMNSSTERTHLKNLGGWLGSLTVARDKPIKFRNISFKDLLIQGHETQRLLIVIPFTCKVLLQAARSTVFRPPNPWLLEIIRILIELYHFADLKLNLKFEIEVLCKGLDLDHKAIEPSDCIRSKPQMEEEFLGPMGAENEGFNDLSLMNLNRARGPSERFSQAAITANLPDFNSLLVFPPPSGNLATQTRIRQILTTAAQQAIAEIITPVVERSVTIAAISATQLIQKDFAMEPDENRLREAAYTMVKSLAGSLALVTCKEPLRMSIINNIRLMARDLPEQALPEGLILMFINDNLDIVCSMVEQAAELQSRNEIELQMEDAFRVRRLYRNARPTEPFRDPIVSQWAFFIPEPYKQQIGGLNREQLAIYEEFGRQSRGIATHANNASQDSGRQVPDVIQDQYPSVSNLPTPAEAPVMPRQGTQQQSRLQGLPSVQTPGALQHMNGYVDAQTVGDRAQELISELQRYASEATEERIDDLGPNSPARLVYEQLITLIEHSGPQKDQFALGVAGKATSFIYEGQKRLEVDIMVRLLSGLCQISVTTARQVIAWLANIDDDRIFNATATVCLINVGLMDLHRVDITVARAIQQRRFGAVEFLSNLMDEILLKDNSSALRADFALSLDALTQCLSEEPGLEVGKQLIAKLQVATTDEALSSPASNDKKDQLEYIFDEWIRLQRPDTPEKTRQAFIHQFHELEALKTKEGIMEFVRVCIDSSVAAFDAEALLPYGSLDNAYINVDALGSLLVSLVIYQGEADGAVKESKAKYLEAVLSFIVLVLCHHHETRAEQFNQKVFFRLFSTILCELHNASNAIAGFQREISLVLAKAFLAVQPNYFAGFSFAWLGLVSHRMFMPAMLKAADEEGWDMYTQIVEALLSYTGELVKPADLSLAARNYYRGVLRVLLVIHHDFPEFLAENHFKLCNMIPIHCTQLRNLIVSAYPSTFPELPDPFTSGLKVDRIEEIRRAPVIRGDIEAPIRQAEIKDVLNNLLKSSDQSTDEIAKICEAIYRPSKQETGHDFAPVTVDTVLLHALVLYIGMTALDAQGPKGPAFNASSPATKLLETLSRELRPEARYHLFSAMANQLRWPNSHTHYFSYAILHLFGSPSPDQQILDVQQTITRVLLERLLVHRPHPWGLIITLLEILKNRTYQFWDLPFVKAAPEVERLFGALFSHIQQSPRALA